MDFQPSEEVEAVRDLAGQIATATCTADALTALEHSGGGWHEALWSALAESELLGLLLPEDVGGSELGFDVLAALVECLAAHAAPVAVGELQLAAAALVRGGAPSDALAGVAAGERIVGLALADEGSRDPRVPATLATGDGESVRLHGVKTAVEAGHRATTFVVSAQGGSGPGLYVVAADAPGLKREEQRGTHGRALSRLEFVDVPAHRLELDLEWLILRVHALQCAEALGVARAAVEMTAKFTATRQQFGAPIATFQAVRQRAADAYVATQVMEVTTRRAVYLVGCDGEASGAVDVARYWASEGGHQVSTAAMHLHGGMGFDRDYPLHRLFLAHKQLETRLGSAEGQLAAIGHTIRQQVSASI